MTSSKYEAAVRELFTEAGIRINGTEPHDISVKDSRFYRRFLADGTLGLGESYMEGWWECDRLDEMMARFSRAKLALKFGRNPKFLLRKLQAKLGNEGAKAKARSGVRHHYDIGNDLYQEMLDPRLVYTCAYFNGTEDLAIAQERKLELVCRKLQLKPGMQVLDIGCGWGSFAKYASEKYGVDVVGVTISEEQIRVARQMCQGLSVEFRLQDYREIQGKFDRILSIGMFEHVCYKNHRTYMETVHRCLTDDGLTLLHSIGRKKSVVRGNDLWITQYIFPNTQVPSVMQIGEAIDGLFVVEDWENLSVNYEKTLLAWFVNFDRNWPKLESKYGPEFYRMWKYYLLVFAGWFRSRALQLWQVVLSKDGIAGGYGYQQERGLHWI